MNNLSVFCADVGSIKSGNFGWSASISLSAEIIQGRDIRVFVEKIVNSIEAGEKVALGFECPLFVPMRSDPIDVNSARKGEGNRSWSAGAGTGALATGLVEVLWVMNQVANALDIQPVATVDWEVFLETDSVFLWEAFVTSSAKGSAHEDDARIAVDAFMRSFPEIPAANAINETQVMSLVGAAALRSGWSNDMHLLSQPCVVIKA